MAEARPYTIDESGEAAQRGIGRLRALNHKVAYARIQEELRLDPIGPRAVQLVGDSYPVGAHAMTWNEVVVTYRVRDWTVQVISVSIVADLRRR